MASVEKFPLQSVRQHLRHIERETQNPKNPDIDPTKATLNYSLTPERSMHSYDYFLKRMDELHHQKRDDLRAMCGWVVTLPTDVPKEREEDFFSCVYRFLCDRYGEENCISCCVHYDESGQPHLHFYFIPTVTVNKKGVDILKISAKERLTRAELRNFGPALQRVLKEEKIPGTVVSGITAKQGGNRTVNELKKERSLERERTIERAGW